MDRTDVDPKTSDPELHLDSILQQLPAVDRDILLLRYAQDMPVEEIARLTGVSAAAAKKRLHRAALKLRARFAERNLAASASFSPVLLFTLAPVPSHLAGAAMQAAFAPTAAVLRFSADCRSRPIQKTNSA